MAEPITALAAISLADNVLSFLKLALTLSREAYSSIDGLPKELHDFTDVTQKLRTTTKGLQSGLAECGTGNNPSMSKADEDLISIAQNCERLASEFVKRLDKYQAKDGYFKAIRTVKKALQVAWNRDEKQRIHGLLQKYQAQFDSRVSVAIRVRIEEIHAQDNANFSKLQQTLDVTIARDIHEIKDLLNRPRSPIPEYFPMYSKNNDIEPSTNLPRLGLPGIRDPLTTADLKVYSTPLHDAVQKGDIVEVRRALTIAKCDVNSQEQEDGQTALHICAAAGFIKIVRFLCQRQADPNLVDLTGSTPLHLAASCGNSEVVGCLLRNGATDTVRDDSDLLAKDYAEQRNDHYMRWILTHGAVLSNQVGPMKVNALQSFIMNEQIEAAKVAIREGADLQDCDDEGNTPLLVSALHGSPELVEIIYAVYPEALDIQNERGETPLMVAAAKENLDLLRLMLSYGPRLDLKDKANGYTALIRCLSNDRFEAADVLLEAGRGHYNLDQEVNDRYFPIQKFAKLCKSRAVEWLLKARVDPNSPNYNGWNPLIEASCSNGGTSTAAVLLAHGAGTEYRESDSGLTAVAMASKGGHLEVVKLLAENGANLNTQCWFLALTPLGHATAEGHMHVVKFLLEKGAYVDNRDKNGYTELQIAYMRRNYEAAKFLLEHGADPSSNNKDFWTPAHEAVSYDRPDLLELLLPYKPNLEIKAKSTRYTPLCFAAAKRKLACVKVLLKASPNLEAYGLAGMKALDEAAIFGQNEMVKCLLEAGADPNGGYDVKVNGNTGSGRQKTDHGWSALMHAASRGHVEVCRMLIEGGANVHHRSLHWTTAVSVAVKNGRDATIALLKQPS